MAQNKDTYKACNTCFVTEQVPGVIIAKKLELSPLVINYANPFTKDIAKKISLGYAKCWMLN